jgi:hypothetical protein
MTPGWSVRIAPSNPVAEARKAVDRSYNGNLHAGLAGTMAGVVDHY